MELARWGLVAAGLMVAACSDKAAKTDQGTGSTKTDSMAGMDMGNHAGTGSMDMMTGMRAHMDSLAQASPEQMRAMMARHEEIGSRILDRMGLDMRNMNMNADAAWTFLSDSVRSDLAELPALSGSALKRRMQGHVDRLGRLMERHEKMMGAMSPK